MFNRYMFGDEDSEVVSTPGKESPYRTPLRDISNEMMDPPSSQFDENTSLMETPQVKDCKKLQMHPTIDIQLINQKLERIKDEIKREVERKLEQMRYEYQQELKVIKEQFLKNEEELEKERFEKRELQTKYESLENRLKSFASKESSPDELAQELIKQAREMQWLQETPTIHIKEQSSTPANDSEDDAEDEYNNTHAHQIPFYTVQQTQPYGADSSHEDIKEDDNDEFTEQPPSTFNSFGNIYPMYQNSANQHFLPPPSMMVPFQTQQHHFNDQYPNQPVPLPASSMDFQMNNPYFGQFQNNGLVGMSQQFSQIQQLPQFTYSEETMVEPVRPPTLATDNYFEKELASPQRDEIPYTQPAQNEPRQEEKKRKETREVKGIYQYTTILQQLNLKSDKKFEPVKTNVKKQAISKKEAATKKKTTPSPTSLKERVHQWKREEREKEVKFTNQQELLEIYFSSKMKGTPSCERLRNIVLHTYQMWNNLNIAFSERERFMDEHILKPISQAGKKADNSRWVMNEEYINNISAAFITEFNRLTGLIHQNGSILKLIGDREQTKSRLEYLKQMEKPPVSEFTELTTMLKKFNIDVTKILSEWEMKNSAMFNLRGFRYLDLVQYDMLIQKEEIEENERKTLQQRIRRSLQ